MRKKTSLFLLLLAAALLLTAYAPKPPATVESPAPVEPAATAQDQAPEAEYRAITAEQAKARMDSGDDLLIVDVRTPQEYESGHIPGALLLPNETIGSTRPDQLPDLDQEILLYCRSGNRSRQAAMKLVAMGYTNVHDFGGVISWPYDLVQGE